jgi:arylsulfatase A-like enzyme
LLGKWHLVAADEMNPASTRRNWPIGRGFERYYGFLGGETNQWYPDLVYDNHYPVGWAWAFNTPSKMWKRYNFEGGVADPMIVSWPKGITSGTGKLRSQFVHATDVAR